MPVARGIAEVRNSGAIAFIFGLAFASTLNLPNRAGGGDPGDPSPGRAQYSRRPQAAGDFQDAFVAWRSM